MLSDVAEGIFEFLFTFFIKVFCFYTGEIILFLLTFGKKKPLWDYYAENSETKFVIMTEISAWIGIFFWIFIIGFIARAILK